MERLLAVLVYSLASARNCFSIVRLSSGSTVSKAWTQGVPPVGPASVEEGGRAGAGPTRNCFSIVRLSSGSTVSKAWTQGVPPVGPACS